MDSRDTGTGRARRAVAALATVVMMGGVAGCAPSAAPPTTTAPAPPTDTPVGLVAVGDQGSGDATQTAIAGAMERWAASHRVDALVTAGDNVYYDGNPALYEARLDGPYRSLLAGRPMWAALGNHDVAGGWGDTQMAHLGLPGRHYEKVVERDGVSVQVLVLDSNQDHAAQAAWLDDRLGAGDHRWRIVVFHHPVWSCSTHGNNSETGLWFAPVIEAHHVDVVLQGHDHLYQRFAPDHTQWIVTGGGGMPLYQAQACAPGTPSPAATHVRHHFMGIEAGQDTLAVSAVTRDGAVLDRVEVH